MQNFRPANKKTATLFKFYEEIMEELFKRGVIRTYNNPVADYAEWLSAKKLGLTLETNSRAGFDGKNKKGTKYQIKCRRLTARNVSTQLGVIRKLSAKEFDYLIGILFNSDFTVQAAYLIPHKVIKKYAEYSEHQHGHILYLRSELLKDKEVKNITNKFV